MQVAQHQNAHHGHGQINAGKTEAAHHGQHGQRSHHNAEAHKCGGFADVLNKAQAAEAPPKPAEPKPAEAKPAEPIATEQKPTEQKPVEPKTAEPHQAHNAIHNHNHCNHRKQFNHHSHNAHHGHHHYQNQPGKFIRPMLSLTSIMHHQPIKADGLKNLQDFLSKFNVAIEPNEVINISIDKTFNITVSGNNNEKAKVIEDLLKSKGVSFM